MYWREVNARDANGLGHLSTCGQRVDLVDDNLDRKARINTNIQLRVKLSRERGSIYVHARLRSTKVILDEKVRALVRELGKWRQKDWGYGLLFFG